VPLLRATDARGGRDLDECSGFAYNLQIPKECISSDELKRGKDDNEVGPTAASYDATIHRICRRELQSKSMEGTMNGMQYKTLSQEKSCPFVEAVLLNL
jgi:hypothetical protein